MNHMTAKNKSIIVADEYLEPRFEKNSKKSKIDGVLSTRF